VALFDFWDHPHALLSYSKKNTSPDEQKMQQFSKMISIRELTISNVIRFTDGLGLATEMTKEGIQQNKEIHPCVTGQRE
jgi:hypothetical protein